MKFAQIIIAASTILLASCSGGKDSDVSATGLAVFTKGNCQTCHQQNAKTVGPSIQDIKDAYQGDKAKLKAFLKEESGAIVDPAQYTVMKNNLAYTKSISPSELDSLASYILK